MIETLAHRGPDEVTTPCADRLGLAFSRLSIMDPDHGTQPVFNENRSVLCVCNGEIFNFSELRALLIERGHGIHTKLDVEVLPHHYEEYGPNLFERLNAQFSLVLFDQQRDRLILARDRFGVQPLFYTNVGRHLIFASEIKAILKHPAARREVDLESLDQSLQLPAIACPRTLFAGIYRVPPGCYIVVENHQVETHYYWDLDYPRLNSVAEASLPDQSWKEELSSLLQDSVKLRLQANYPIAIYLSGGLDSSLIAANVAILSKNIERHSFSIASRDPLLCEAQYQRLVAEHCQLMHHEIPFAINDIINRLRTAVYHSECPLKETYNTASLALSAAARSAGFRVVLSGEGADELFAGYPSYKFDSVRTSSGVYLADGEQREANLSAWGEPYLTYDKDVRSARRVQSRLLSTEVLEVLRRNSPSSEIIRKEMIRDRHPIHQRSYIDFKLRLEGHLLADHGDRMAMANSVEARYPFLDHNVVSCVTRIPPHLKLNCFVEKYILKRIAGDLLPPSVVNRNKFPFVSDNSSRLCQQQVQWVEDVLSEDRIRREGYFNPTFVTKLHKQYTEPGFELMAPYEDDLLLTVLTFGILLEQFSLPPLN